MTTDPLYVLAHAVETAQRTASEIVADAIRAAEQAGYERGRREAPASSAPAGLLAVLKRATDLAHEVGRTGTSIDGLCDDMTLTMKRARGRRGSSISVPSRTDSFDDVKDFLEQYGDMELVDPESAEVDADEVRTASESIVQDIAKLHEALDEIRDLLSGEGEEPEGEDESPHPSLDAHRAW
jgi:hypothetical protein